MEASLIKPRNVPSLMWLHNDRLCVYLITGIMRIKGGTGIKAGLRRKLNSDAVTSAELNFIL